MTMKIGGLSRTRKDCRRRTAVTMAWCDAPTVGGRKGIIRCSEPRVLDYTAHGMSVVEKRTWILHERRFEREEISPHHIDDMENQGEDKYK